MIYQRFVTCSLLIFTGIILLNLGCLTQRSDFSFLIGQVVFLVLLLSIVYYRKLRRIDGFKRISVYLFTGLAFRFILLFNLPTFSDDFYRFLWDGSLVLDGFNPYVSTPQLFSEIELTDYMQMLLVEMNSPNYFSVYPPLNQWIFTLANFICPESLIGQVITLKSVIFFSEGVIIFTLPRLLTMLGLHTSHSLLYILNPLVILETVGNIHFESLTAMFLVLFLLFAIQKKYWVSSCFFALAVHVKLIPLIILPLILIRFKSKNGLKFLSVLVFVSILFITPFFHPDLISNFNSGYGYYFEKFEFNASLYYLLREVGFWISGYNQIQILGTSLIVLFIVSLILLMRNLHLRKEHFFKILYFVFIIYYLCSTTIHPWYVINVLLLGICAGFGYSAACWSFSVFLSYRAYSEIPVHENLWLVSLEYVLFFIVLMYEYKNRKGGQIEAQVLKSF